MFGMRGALAVFATAAALLLCSTAAGQPTAAPAPAALQLVAGQQCPVPGGGGFLNSYFSPDEPVACPVDAPCAKIDLPTNKLGNDDDPAMACFSCGATFGAGLGTAATPPPGLCGARNAQDGDFDFSCVLEAALQFFEAQMTGPLPAAIKERLPWRGDTLLSDVAPNGAPLLKGWFDGGDTTRFVFPQAWAVSVMALSFRDFPDAFAAAGIEQRFRDQIQWSADFLAASRYEPGSMVAYTSMPGNITQSHNWWGRAEDVSQPSVVVAIHEGDPAADLLAEVAAALAAASVVLQGHAPDNITAGYLSVAEDAFAQATRSEGLHSLVVKELEPFYNSTSYLDDMAWGAVWLYLATGNETYLQQAESYYSRFEATPQFRSHRFSWDNVGQAAGLLLGELVPGRWREYSRSARFAAVDWVLGNGKLVQYQDGMPFVDQWGNARYAMAEAFIVGLLANHTRSAAAPSDIPSEYACMGRQWLRVVLGDAGPGMVAGVGSGVCAAAHRGSSCPANLTERCDCTALLNTACNPTVLTGALVGGPGLLSNGSMMSLADWQSVRQSYQTSEPALDFNTGLLSALAAQVAQEPGLWDRCQAAGLTFPRSDALASDAEELADYTLSSYGIDTGTSFGQHGWDPVGTIALGVVFGGAALYIVACYLVARAADRREWPLIRGTFRLAAARDDVHQMDLLYRHAGRSKLAGVEAALPDGFTALHAATIKGNARATLWLCQRAADVAAVKHDKWNDQALHYAAAAGSLDCCRVLLAFGASLAAEDFAGQTAAVVAAGNGHDKVAAWLEAVAAGEEQPPSADDLASELGVSAASAQSEGKLDSNSAGKSGSGSGSDSDGVHGAAPLTPGEEAEMAVLLRRPHDGLGSPGIALKRGTIWYRVAVIPLVVVWVWYLVWRAEFSLATNWYYFFSVPVLLAELWGFLATVPLLVCLWHQGERPVRHLPSIEPAAQRMPSVDVYVVCYSEPVDVIEPTVVAARNMSYPVDKLNVYVCDDGKRDEIRDMAARIGSVPGGANVVYVARQKAKGVPHHAKAGNINHTLLKGPAGVGGRGDFVLILDCDMIVHPSYLHITLGHFYQQQEGGTWELKPRCGFLQTPQDFWNIPDNDPLGQAGRMFYGPLQKGRDGCGAVCCCGTGVMFNRDALVSVGGQEYGSITEDNYTAQKMSAAGFSSMYLNDRIMFGMAPDDLDGLLTQRLRWAQGALQILLAANPLTRPGLAPLQRLMYLDACIYPLSALPLLFICIVPLVWCYSKGYVSPIEINSFTHALWDLLTLFVAFFGLRELTFWLAMRGEAHYGASASTELVRSTQQAYWLACNHAKAMWRVFRADTRLGRLFGSASLGFVVTKKGEAGEESHLQIALALLHDHLWFWVAFALASLGAIAYFIVYAIVDNWQVDPVFLGLTAIMWMVFTLSCVWPVLSVLLPWRNAGEDQKWEIEWRQRTKINLGALASADPSHTVPGQIATTTVGDMVRRGSMVHQAGTLPPAQSGLGSGLTSAQMDALAKGGLTFNQLAALSFVSPRTAATPEPSPADGAPAAAHDGPAPVLVPDFSKRRRQASTYPYYLSMAAAIGFLIAAVVVDETMGTAAQVQRQIWG